MEYQRTDISLKIRTITRILSTFYPTNHDYCSRCSLYLRALNDGIITKEEFTEAKIYYGKLWNYVGD